MKLGTEANEEQLWEGRDRFVSLPSQSLTAEWPTYSTAFQKGEVSQWEPQVLSETPPQYNSVEYTPHTHCSEKNKRPAFTI